MTNATAFPDDLATCHAIIAERNATLAECNAMLASKDRVIEQQADRLEEQKQRIAKLAAERDAALQLAFRKKVERYLHDPKQFILDFGDTPDVIDMAEGIADAALEGEDTTENVDGYKRHKRGTRKRRNEQLPDHLPRHEVKLEVPEDKKVCPTHGERRVIGYDWQETLEVEPAKLFVRRVGIPKLACPADANCGVVEGERPVGLVEGNRYAASVAAEIITAKYSYHLPVYRQQDIFASCGWTPARSTLQNVLKAAAHLVHELIQHFHGLVRAGPIIGTDETTVTLVINNAPLPTDESNPKTARALEVIADAREKQRGSITSRMWVYRSVTVPINVFDFTVSRHRDGPELFLAGFTGGLMADCYAGFEAVRTASGGSFVRAACASHARRKFFNARENHPVHASRLLAMFQELYDIEDRAKSFTPEDRQALRNAEARPVWQRMSAYVNGDTVADVMPKEPFGQAITYLRNQFEHLLVYLDDGLMPIDNNDAEQLMKQVALGRKNWMIIGSVEAGYRAADIMTLVSSAARNDLDVFAYVRDVLERLLAGETDYDALRPDAWKQSHPEAVRIYRQEERSSRAEAKATRRARRRMHGKAGG